MRIKIPMAQTANLHSNRVSGNQGFLATQNSFANCIQKSSGMANGWQGQQDSPPQQRAGTFQAHAPGAWAPCDVESPLRFGKQLLLNERRVTFTARCFIEEEEEE